MKRRLAVCILLTAVALIAGCGRGDGDGDSGHNAQDVSFAKDMVPHHQQAVTMADLALSNGAGPPVQALATRIKASQTAEISLMQGWLAAWGEEATDHRGHDMGTAEEAKGMKGMVSDADMATLAGARGGDFDRLFLQHMTAHHEGALEMAKVQLDEGRFGPAKDLARSISTSQQQEIAEMGQMLSASRPAGP